MPYIMPYIPRCPTAAHTPMLRRRGPQRDRLRTADGRFPRPAALAFADSPGARPPAHAIAVVALGAGLPDGRSRRGVCLDRRSGPALWRAGALVECPLL